MSINSLNPPALAAPYLAPGSVVPSQRGPERAAPAREKDVGAAGQDTSRVAVVEKAQDNHQRRQPGQWSINPLLFHEKPGHTPRIMPGPQILAELISRMGGTGDEAGPGQLFNIAV